MNEPFKNQSRNSFIMKIKLGINSTWILMFGLLTSVNAAQSELDLTTIKSNYKQGNFQQVIEDGHHLLKKHPNDADAQLFIALSYYQLKNYSKAESNFKSILKTYPHYKDASLGLIRTDIAQKKYDDAIRVIHTSETQYPNDPALLNAKNKVNYLRNKNRMIDKPKSKTTTQSELNHGVPQLISTGKAATMAFPTVAPYWELTAYTLNASVNTPPNVWDWSSVYLYRKNQYGAFGGAVNYANRFGQSVSQLLLNAQPKITDKLWLDVGYANANNPTLLPDDTIFGEVYGIVGNSVELSLGDSYKKIEHTYFNTYTGSIGKYISNYYFSFRPNHYVPKSGPKSTLYTVRARRYGVDNPAQYFGIGYSAGTSPDLYDLLTVTFFRVRENIIFVEGQQPITNSFAFIYGAGYETQKYPNAFVRRLPYMNIGVKLAIA